MFNPDDWTQDFTLAVARVARGMIEEGGGGGEKGEGGGKGGKQNLPHPFYKNFFLLNIKATQPMNYIK